MNKFIKIIPITLFICIIFLSVGFASFSSNLSISDIKASVRNVKDIRVTNFYAIEGENGAESTWEEYSSDVIASNILMPNIDSTISYKIEITNLGNTIMMIDNITGLPDNMTYEIENYELNKKICDDDKEFDSCILGIQKEIIIKIMYKENAEIIDDDQLIQLNIDFEEYTYQIVFDANGGFGSINDIYLKYDEMISLPTNTFTLSGYKFDSWNTKEDGSGVSYSNEEVIQNINTNDESLVTLYAQWIEANEGFYYPGYCIFNGKNKAVEGECNDGVHLDYVDTGIKLFSEENYQRNFILSFTIKEISDDAFTSNNRDTIFNSLLEEGEGDYGKYPGLVLRTEGSKWFLQASRGQEPNYASKILFNKENLLNKEIKIIRLNDGQTIKIYYMIGNNGPFLLKDITELYSPFDTTLMFGASVINDTICRHSKTTLKDISFEFLEDGLTLEDITGTISAEEDNFSTVFSQEGKCIFNGSNSNITGSDCSFYWDTNYIDTDISLFGIENLNKDFEIYFEIDEFIIANQDEKQATILNAFKERSGTTGYGLLFRRANSGYQLLIRDGNGKEKSVTLNTSQVSSLKIIKKGNNVCYSTNYGQMKFLINLDNFYAPFDIPLTFGAGTSKEGQIFRHINGELSNMYIKTGKIDDSIICEPGM